MTWDLIGHSWAEKMLQQHIISGQVRHAYLFTGPAGVGRRTLAIRFAQAINCLQPISPGEPCKTCRACIQIERMQHPDLSIVQADTSGAVLKVERVRDLQRQLSLAPYEARFRIALLLHFEEANDNAQNALLKTLEEPNDRVILLMTADLAENLLPTIVSRCEVLRLHPAGLEELAAALVKNDGASPTQARLLAHITGGRAGYAIHLLREPELIEKRKYWLEDALQLMHSNRREKFSYVKDKFDKRDDRNVNKEALRAAMITWLSFWRDILLISSTADVPLTNLDFENQEKEIAVLLNLPIARAAVQGIEQGMVRLNNANLRLLAESILLQWPTLS